MTRGLFISEEFIKNNSQIDENVDMKKILPVVWQCQTQHMQSVLGSQLYNDLIAKVIAGTLAGDDLKLVEEYVADALLYWVMYEVQIPLLFNFRNKSTATNNSDHSTPITTKELSRIENRFKDKAEFFSERITNYLCANTALYPLYLTATSSDDVIAEQAKPTVSVFLGETARPKCNKYLY